MRIITAIVQLALVALLASCDQQESTSYIDPMLGRDCFESLRASLPPGTQYEGIDHVAQNRLTIKIMNGIDVEMVECALNPDGTLQGAADRTDWNTLSSAVDGDRVNPPC